MAAATLPHIVHKPAAEISIPAEWALVPTEEELRAADRARAAFKADQRIFAQPDHYQLEQQQRREGGAS